MPHKPHPYVNAIFCSHIHDESSGRDSILGAMLSERVRTHGKYTDEKTANFAISIYCQIVIPISLFPISNASMFWHLNGRDVGESLLPADMDVFNSSLQAATHWHKSVLTINKMPFVLQEGQNHLCLHAMFNEVELQSNGLYIDLLANPH